MGTIFRKNRDFRRFTIQFALLTLLFLLFNCGETIDADTPTYSGETIGADTPTYNRTHNYITFNRAHLAHGDGLKNRVSQSFTVHNDVANIAQIKMYVQLNCPTGGCGQWDVYAHVRVKDKATDGWFELGRFITPYGYGNRQLQRGFEFDVTDFKTLLTGTSELQIFAECWDNKGYYVTVDFDYIEGKPDYKYYTIAKILDYSEDSQSGIPYGTNHDFVLNKSIEIPINAANKYLRTIISGWGHAVPADDDGETCAEWCFRKHSVLIDAVPTFTHSLEALGCANNPVTRQRGNWKVDRAGWCPGMEVPVRVDSLAEITRSSFEFEYAFQDWQRDNVPENTAYYAISTYIVVKSNTSLDKTIVRSISGNL